MAKLSVRLIIDTENRQWIVGKFANRLEEHLRAWDVEADVGGDPNPHADVNHWMMFAQPWHRYYREPGFFGDRWRPDPPTKHTALITHVDDPVKVQLLRDSIPRILDVGICMSRMTKAELVAHGIPQSHLTYVLPAHDGAVRPRRVVVGITSKFFRDGRKNADVLFALAASMRLDAFRFEIFGEGWEEVAAVLRGAGAEVEMPSDTSYAHILQRLPAFDYYLYLGWDEGSMGTLDALAAGVKTIVTPQGFHLDLRGAITHPVRNAADLVAVFRKLAADRQVLLDSVKELTWSEYARRHAAIWRALLDGCASDVAAEAGEADHVGDRPITSDDIDAAKSRIRRRLFRSIVLRDYLDSRKFWMRAKLSRMKRWALRRP